MRTTRQISRIPTSCTPCDGGLITERICIHCLHLKNLSMERNTILTGSCGVVNRNRPTPYVQCRCPGSHEHLAKETYLPSGCPRTIISRRPTPRRVSRPHVCSGKQVNMDPKEKTIPHPRHAHGYLRRWKLIRVAPTYVIQAREIICNVTGGDAIAATSAAVNHRR